jgi:hypothetical protein
MRGEAGRLTEIEAAVDVQSLPLDHDRLLGAQKLDRVDHLR